MAYGNLADFYSYAGQHSEAVVAAERALELAAKLGSAEIEWQMRTVIGRAQRAVKQPEVASVGLLPPDFAVACGSTVG